MDRGKEAVSLGIMMSMMMMICQFMDCVKMMLLIEDGDIIVTVRLKIGVYCVC